MRARRNAFAWSLALGVMLLIPANAVWADEYCLDCHASGMEVVEDPAHELDVEAYEASIHFEMGFACTDCHSSGDFEAIPHEGMETPQCADCHADSQEDFEASIHAGVEEFGDQSCGACHSIHEIRAIADPESRTFATNQPGTCGNCHADDQVVGDLDLDIELIRQYQGSVHGLALDADGEQQPAVCSDCHGGHLILPANEAESRINPFNLTETCGECHEQASEEYSESVHGVAFSKGRTASPTCTVCHGIHTIRHVPEPGASPQEARLVRTTCTSCHASAALMSGLGVDATRVSSYEASFHGLVRSRGEAAVADCASCHGVHGIYHSSDPRSMVHDDNLQETCGDCHPGAGEQFAAIPVHYVGAPGGDLGQADTGTVVIEWVERIYWVLLFGVLGGMLIHNIIIISWYMRRNWARDKQSPMRRRFDTAQVIQHAMLVTSFAVLVISGFMLAYPDTWWGRLMVDLGVSEEIRRWTHRVAAIVMIAASILHVFWMFGTKYGRAEFQRIAPKMRDVREVIQNMKFHLGASDRPAAFAKYDYPAKAEYWALVWGTVIMAVTGLMLWFPVLTTSFLPGWTLKLAEIIHLFEAWLATLAIIIFHFFYVFGHPEVYPLSFSMFHGGMREDVAKHHHPGWKGEEEEPATSN